MKITLRKRKLKTGGTSLYLDIYHNGKREYEPLSLFLVTPKTSLDRKSNRETLLVAEAHKAERQIQLQNGTYGFRKALSGDKDFLAFFKKLCEERFESVNNYGNWLSTYNHLYAYSKNNLRFQDVNEAFIEGFKNYLLTAKLTKANTRLAQNSAHSYFNKLKAALNRAVELKLINDNPARRVKSIQQEETNREYLNLEELKLLANTDCRYPILKNAFIFSSLTGLRWSDINKLIWEEVQYSESTGWRLVFKQKKTNGQEYLPISNEARELLGEKSDSFERVFKGLKYSAYMNVGLSQWILKAGITKTITFHCARHTHATLLLTNGVDIYTVSKLLGHKALKTTQVYAKIIDQKKIDAVNSIPKIF
jgi:integrase